MITAIYFLVVRFANPDWYRAMQSDGDKWFVTYFVIPIITIFCDFIILIPLVSALTK